MAFKNWFVNTHRNHLAVLIVTACLALLIGYFTLSPASFLSIAGSDKIHHLIGFFALTIPGALLYRHALYWLLPSVIAFGGAIELIQPYVNRRGEWADFWADTAGALLGVGVGLLLRHIFRNRIGAQ